MNLGGAPMSIADLILHSSPLEAVPMADVLSCQKKLLFIIDGFDELKRPELPVAVELSSDPYKKHVPATLVTGLLQKKLLPKSYLIVTTRPTALEKLQKCLKSPRFVEVLGFSPAQRKEYFHRFFEDNDRATQAFSFVQENEILFGMCFLPIVCWIVCFIFRQLPEGEHLQVIRETATTTEVHMFLLSRFLEHHTMPNSLEGLCSLANDGILQQKMIFEEEELMEHGVDASVSESLPAPGHAFVRDAHLGTMYEFIHLTFQEFFAALFYLLDPEGRTALPKKDVNQILGNKKECRLNYFMLVHFLFGLSNRKRLSYLERTWGCKTLSQGLGQNLLSWVEAEAQQNSLGRGERLMDLCHCMYDLEDEGFTRSVMERVYDLDLRDQLSTKLDYKALLFCLQACHTLQSLRLSSYELGPGEHTALLPGLLKSSVIQLHRCGLMDPAGKDLDFVLVANQSLTELDLGENPLGDSGVRYLCAGLKDPGCKLQRLGLHGCGLRAAACEELASVLESNPCLNMLDLGENQLGDAGARWLCEGLKHPRCRIQSLTLHVCGLTATACVELSSVLEASQTLTELELGDNELGDAGVRRLCEALTKPHCKLQRLTLTTRFLNPDTKAKLAALPGAHPEMILIPYYPPDFPVFFKD
uniref:NACHT domain-containing protein n=1 Tax=Sphenodon punctatus TaxID=8508 RepID=A0A8D0GUP7_SPHPU